MKHVFGAVLAGVLLAACAHAEEDKAGHDEASHAAETAIGVVHDRGLVRATSPIPAIAKDSREDGVLRDETNRPVTHDLLGQKMAAFEAPLMGEGVFNSGALDGRWTVMVYWGVWCHDSRNDAGNIAAVATHFATHPDVQFMSMHVPFRREFVDRRFGDYGSVEAYFAESGLSWPVALDEDASLRTMHKIRWTPTYLLIGPDKTVEAFRTDLSVAGEDAVERFIGEVEGMVGEAA